MELHQAKADMKAVLSSLRVSTMLGTVTAAVSMLAQQDSDHATLYAGCTWFVLHFAIMMSGAYKEGDSRYSNCTLSHKQAVVACVHQRVRLYVASNNTTVEAQVYSSG